MKKFISIILSLIVIFTVSQQTITVYAASKSAAPKVTSSKKLKSYKLTKGEKAVFDETNKMRKKNGAKPVKYSPVLHSIACIRAKEASKKWSHERPNGTYADQLFKDYGIKYTKAGENLYCGDADAKKILKLWMGSPSHRENVVRKCYTYLGVGSYTKTDKKTGQKITYYCQIYYKR